MSNSMLSNPDVLYCGGFSFGSLAYGLNLLNSSPSSPGAVVYVSHGANNIIINVNHYFN